MAKRHYSSPRSYNLNSSDPMGSDSSGVSRRYDSDSYGEPKHYNAKLSGHLHQGHYEDHAHRLAMEEHDGDMIPSGSGYYANMPQEVVHRLYSEPNQYMPESLDDSIRGVDWQIRLDGSHRNAHLKPKKV